MVCCCGRMRRPFGAAASTGTTSTTTSDGESRSPTMRLPFPPCGIKAPMRSLSAWMFSPVFALTAIASGGSGAPVPRSDLL